MDINDLIIWSIIIVLVALMDNLWARRTPFGVVGAIILGMMTIGVLVSWCSWKFGQVSLGTFIIVVVITLAIWKALHTLRLRHALKQLASDNVVKALDTTYTLAKMGPSAIAPLTAALQDSNSDIRWRATLALERIGERALEKAHRNKASLELLKKVITGLTLALQDPNNHVQREAAEALGSVLNGSAAEQLLSYLPSLDDELVVIILSGIARRGDESAEELLFARAEAGSHAAYYSLRDMKGTYLGGLGLIISKVSSGSLGSNTHAVIARPNNFVLLCMLVVLQYE